MEIINDLPYPDGAKTVALNNSVVERKVVGTDIKENMFVSKVKINENEFGVSRRITSMLYGIALEAGKPGDYIHVAISDASKKQ